MTTPHPTPEEGMTPEERYEAACDDAARAFFNQDNVTPLDESHFHSAAMIAAIREAEAAGEARGRAMEREQMLPYAPAPTRSPPMTDSAETMRDLKHSKVFSFDDGLLTIKISGYGQEDGWGTLAFHERQIEIDADGFHCVEIAPSELREIRDFLNRVTKPGPSDPIPSQPDEREEIARLLTAAKLLQQHAVGCATNHHGHDCELNGLPGWLADTKNNIDAAEDAIIAMQAERRGHDPLGDLVQRFADALLAKLRLAQANGRSGWDQDDWEEACRKGLMRHIEKGDPRDVAAYCAFMWHHGWSTAPPKPDPIAPLTEGSFVKGGHNSFPSQIKDRPAAPAPINKPPAQPAPIAGLEPVQETWFSDRALPVLAMSGDVENDRALKLHFRRPVTDADRRDLTDALNLHIQHSRGQLYTRAQLEAHAAEQVRPLVEVLKATLEEIERVEADVEYSLPCGDKARAAIRARGQV